MAKLNHKDILIAYTGATIASVTTGLVGSYIWSKFGYDVDTSLVVSSAWLLTVGVPSVGVSTKTLWERLGQKETATVKAIGRNSGGRRAIPFQANGRQGNIFLSSIPWLKSQDFRSQTEDDKPDLPTVFEAQIEGNSYSITLPELEDFLRIVWRRQRAGNEHPLSRPYFTKQNRPRLKRLEYQTRINILLSCNGLILDRDKRRSGRLAVSPTLAIRAIDHQFQLA